MKLYLRILPLLLLPFLCNTQEKASKYVALEGGKFYWIITKNTTNKDLEYIEQLLDKKGVTFRFRGVWRDKKGKIERIDSIICKQAYSSPSAVITPLLKAWNKFNYYNKRPLLFHFTPNYGCSMDLSMFGYPVSLRQVTKAEGLAVEPSFEQMDSLKNSPKMKAYLAKTASTPSLLTITTDGPTLKEQAAIGYYNILYVRSDETLDIVEKYRDSTQIYVRAGEISLAQLNTINVNKINKVQTHIRPYNALKSHPQDKKYVIWIEQSTPKKL